MIKNHGAKNYRLELSGFDRKSGEEVRAIDITGRANLAATAEILSRRPARLFYQDCHDYPLNRRMRSAMKNRIQGLSLEPNLDWVVGVTVANPKTIPFLRTPMP
jgi:hypothetical protein